MSSTEALLLATILGLCAIQGAAALVGAWRRRPDFFQAAGLKDDLEGLSMGFDDLTARLSNLSAAIHELRREIDALTARQAAADDRCATCVLRPRPDALAPGE